MPTQGDFWVFVFIGLLITNLALLFYVKLDFDKKVNVLSQEVKSVKENLANDKNVGELLRGVKGVNEGLLHVKQDFDKRMIELLQEVNDIKANKNAGELVQQVKDVKENLIHIQQNFSNKLMDLLQEVNDIKGRLILDLDKKVSKLSQEVESMQVKDIKENLIHIQQNLDKKLAELLQEVNDIKVRLILDIDKKMDKFSQEVESIREKIEKVNTEMKQLEQQTRERIDYIAKLLTEPILDESQLRI
jgi:DNA repair exonuclease SbcCD ATPase subunit